MTKLYINRQIDFPVGSLFIKFPTAFTTWATTVIQFSAEVLKARRLFLYYFAISFFILIAFFKLSS